MFFFILCLSANIEIWQSNLENNQTYSVSQNVKRQLRAIQSVKRLKPRVGEAEAASDISVYKYNVKQHKQNKVPEFPEQGAGEAARHRTASLSRW